MRRILPKWVLPSLPLGKVPDAQIARKLRCGSGTVHRWRSQLGIPRYSREPGSREDSFFESEAYYELQDFVLEKLDREVPRPFRRIYASVQEGFGSVCEAYVRRTLRAMVEMGLLAFFKNLPGPEQGYVRAR